MRAEISSAQDSGVTRIGLVSPGAARQLMVSPHFFFKKTDDLFSHRPLESDDLLAVVSSLLTSSQSFIHYILSKFSHKD